MVTPASIGTDHLGTMQGKTPATVGHVTQIDGEFLSTGKGVDVRKDVLLALCPEAAAQQTHETEEDDAYWHF